MLCFGCGNYIQEDFAFECGIREQQNLCCEACVESGRILTRNLGYYHHCVDCGKDLFHEYEAWDVGYATGTYLVCEKCLEDRKVDITDA